MFDSFLQDVQRNLITQGSILIAVLVLIAGGAYAALYPRLFLLMVKNLRRNLVRTGLTVLATGVLVFMIIMIWTILSFIEAQTEEKTADFKLIITERWSIPSRLPPRYVHALSPVKLNSDLSVYLGAKGPERNPDFVLDKHEDLKGKFTEKDFMSWSFYGGSTVQDPKARARENIVFFFAMNPDQIQTMMDELDTLPDEIIRKLKSKTNACLLGSERLKALNLEVGKTFKVYSFGYKDIDLDFEVVDELPGARYSTAGIMNIKYLYQALDAWKQTKSKDKSPHPEANRFINLIWLRVKDKDTFSRVQQIVEEESVVFSERPVKCETASSGIASFLDAYRDIFLGVKYLLVPAVLASMALIIANAISINVRERRTEMAVLKVLGYRPNLILYLVLGESILVGALSGLVAALIAFLAFNLTGGIQFPVAFFPAFPVPLSALFWGPAMGALTAFLGSISPSWSARSVRVTEVFSKVA